MILGMTLARPTLLELEVLLAEVSTRWKHDANTLERHIIVTTMGYLRGRWSTITHTRPMRGSGYSLVYYGHELSRERKFHYLRLHSVLYVYLYDHNSNNR